MAVYIGAVAMEPEYVLDEFEDTASQSPPGRMGQPTARNRSDMSWHEFVITLHELPTDDATKLVILAVVVGAEGRKGQTVDWDTVAAAVGRKPGTIKNMRTRLRRTGWLTTRAKVNDNDRAVLEYVTARSVG